MWFISRFTRHYHSMAAAASQKFSVHILLIRRITDVARIRLILQSTTEHQVKKLACCTSHRASSSRCSATPRVFTPKLRILSHPDNHRQNHTRTVLARLNYDCAVWRLFLSSLPTKTLMHKPERHSARNNLVPQFSLVRCHDASGLSSRTLDQARLMSGSDLRYSRQVGNIV